MKSTLLIFINMEKKCNDCKLIKPLDEFHLKQRGKMGRAEICKSCKKKRDKKRWESLSDDYREKKKERERIYYHEVIKLNPEKKKINRSKESVNRIKRNYRSKPLVKLKESMRKCVGRYLNSIGVPKDNRTFDIVGCTPEFLKEYITKQLKDNMTWDNYGKWHIDHIIPLCSAKTKDELYKLFHYTNLQPLWAKDNISKGGKIL